MSMQASMPTEVPAAKPATRRPNPTWREVLASVFAVVFDIIMVFIVGGYVIAFLTGNLKGGEFNLSGGSAAMLMLVVFAYFIICMKYFGGTLWQRTLGVGRR